LLLQCLWRQALEHLRFGHARLGSCQLAVLCIWHIPSDQTPAAMINRAGATAVWTTTPIYLYRAGLLSAQPPCIQLQSQCSGASCRLFSSCNTHL
jgi:hypothetical protein